MVLLSGRLRRTKLLNFFLKAFSTTVLKALSFSVAASFHASFGFNTNALFIIVQMNIVLSEVEPRQ